MAEAELKPLSHREEQFCQEYTLCYVGSRAAIAVGYKESTAAKQACKMLKDPRIQQRIREIQKELADRQMITRERIVLELVDAVEICKAAKPVEVWDYVHHEMRETGEYQIDAKNLVKALVELARFCGLDKSDEGSAGDGPVFYTGEDDIKE